MIFYFSNATIILTRLLASGPVTEMNLAGRTVRLLGQPNLLVDYEALDYQRDYRVISAQFEPIVRAYLDSPGGCTQLARLSGDFLVLVSRGDQLERIATSDSTRYMLYYWERDGRLHFHDDWRPFAEGIDVLDPDSYDLVNLRWFGQHRGCPAGQTFLHGLRYLQAATSHVLTPQGVREERAVIAHNTQGREFSLEQLLGCLGKALPREDCTLAYSTGVDSQIILVRNQELIKELATLYYAPPYQGDAKTREVAAAFVNAVEMELPFNLVEVDFDDPHNLDYLRHAVRQNPFSHHLSVSIYTLVKRARHGHVLAGEGADAFLYFADKGRIPWRRLLSRRTGLDLPVLRRLLVRVRLRQFFDRGGCDQALDNYFAAGTLAQYIEMSGDYGRGYWPLTYMKMVGFTPGQDVWCWHSAGQYFGKQTHFPYAEPLVRYVSAHMRRPWSALLDPKRQVQAAYPRRTHLDIQPPVRLGQPLEESRLYQGSARDMGELRGALKDKFDQMAKRNSARLFLYQFAYLAASAPQNHATPPVLTNRE